MSKWAYIDICDSNWSSIMESLRSAGKQGWKLVSMMSKEREWKAVLKRRLGKREKKIRNKMITLGSLAAKFRGGGGPKQDAETIKQIREEYAAIVKQLIADGNWLECLAPEDELPDELMPKEYFEYFGMRGPR